MEPVDILSTLGFKREMMQSGCITVVSLASASGFRGVKPQRCIRAAFGLQKNHLARRLAGDLVAKIAHNWLVEGPGTSQVAHREIHVMDWARHCRFPQKGFLDARRRFSETHGKAQVRDHEGGTTMTSQPHFSSGYAPSGRAQLYFETAGTGDDLVFLHAGVSDSRMWDPQMQNFAVKFRVIRYDHRGFGKTKFPEEPFALRDDLSNL